MKTYGIWLLVKASRISFYTHIHSALRTSSLGVNTILPMRKTTQPAFAFLPNLAFLNS
jgi:hypothetical protein